MQMIADGKINKDIKFDVLNKKGMIYTANATIDNVTMRELLDLDFEILEDTTEEIEELDMAYTHHNIDHTEIMNKINELIRAVNKLNNTTYKAENCMTD